MREVWKTLGLDEQPKDMKSLKRAYSARLKTTRPEEDAAGFMALRQAFERAQHIMRAQEQSVVESPIVDMASQEVIHIVAGEDAAQNLVPDTPAPLSPANQAIQQLHEMMSHPFKRNDIASWEEIFSRDALETLDDWVEFDHRLRDYLLQIFGAYDDKKEDHNRNRKPKLLSTKTGTFIFDKMDWHDTDSRNLGIAEELAWLREDLDVIAPHSKTFNNSVHSQPVPTQKEPLDPRAIWFLCFAAFMVLKYIATEYGFF